MSYYKLKPEFKEAWLAALRSGEYQQTRGQLRRDNAFCCLGVACDLAQKMGLVPGMWSNGAFEITPNDQGWNMPPQGVVEAIFEGENPRSATHAFYIPSERRGLDGLNDLGYTFSELAKIIETDF